MRISRVNLSKIKLKCLQSTKSSSFRIKRENQFTFDSKGRILVTWADVKLLSKNDVPKLAAGVYFGPNNSFNHRIVLREQLSNERYQAQTKYIIGRTVDAFSALYANMLAIRVLHYIVEVCDSIGIQDINITCSDIENFSWLNENSNRSMVNILEKHGEYLDSNSSIMRQKMGYSNKFPIYSLVDMIDKKNLKINFTRIEAQDRNAMEIAYDKKQSKLSIRPDVQPIKNEDINLALEIIKKSGKNFEIPISKLREEIAEKASKYASRDPYYHENQEIISKWRAENLD
jgi:hypothetical protein